MNIRNRFKRREKSCDWCCSKIPLEALKCMYCCAQQEKRPCVVCAEKIPATALWCSQCKSYQKGPRRIFSVSNTTIAWFTAFFAVISTLVTAGSNVLDRESSTAFKVTGTKNGMIRIEAWNTGHKPGMLLDYELSFDPSGVNVSPTPLPLDPTLENGAPRERRIIIPVGGKPQQIDLRPSATLTVPCRASDRQCLDGFRQQLIKQRFAVNITIVESGRWWKFWRPLEYSHSSIDENVPGKVIEGFFTGACCHGR